MKSRLLLLVSFVIFLFPSKTQNTITAPPVPQNVTLPVDQAAANLLNSAYQLDEVGGNVVITNADGTTAVIDAHGLAQDLRDEAVQLSNNDSNTITIADGGNVQFIPLNPQSPKPKNESNDEELPTPVFTTVVPTIAPNYPYNKTLPANQAKANLLDSASRLDQVNGYVVISSPNGTVSVVIARDLIPDLLDQADGLSNLGTTDVSVLDGGRIRFAPLSQINGFSPVHAVILDNEGKNLSVVKLETSSGPVVSAVQAAHASAFTFETILPANEAVRNLRDSADKLAREGGYVVFRHPNATVDIVTASSLAKHLRKKAGELSDLGSTNVLINDAGKVKFASITKVEGFSPIDAFTVNEDGTVSIINLSGQKSVVAT